MSLPDPTLDLLLSQDIWNETVAKRRILPKSIPHKRYSTDKEGPGSHFKIGEFLGNGSFGRVFKAKNTRTNQHFAMKIAEKPSIKQTKKPMLRVTEREISILRICTHPNIIELTQIIETPRIVYMVLELCHQSIAKILLKIHCLSEDQIRQVVQQVASALVYLHSNEIAHRDLKLSNILCKTDPKDTSNLFWQVKLSDFGLAACRGPPGTTELFKCSCGTHTFMAPEVLVKDPYDQKCDLFSLGVVIFYCLIGEEPFPGRDEEEVKRRHATSKVTLTGPEWDVFSPAIRFLVKKLLQYDPLSRYSSFQLYNHEWTQGKKNIPEETLEPRRQYLMPNSSNELISAVKEYLDSMSS